MISENSIRFGATLVMGYYKEKGSSHAKHQFLTIFKLLTVSVTFDAKMKH